MIQIDAAIEECKNMNFFEKMCLAFFILALVGTLSALMFSYGPMVPIVNYINYKQAIILQKIFGGELLYYGKLTIIIICLICAIPMAIAKYHKKMTSKA